MTQEAEADVWPALDHADLDGFRHALSIRILSLETAYCDGTLAELLASDGMLPGIGPSLHETYSKLIGRTVGKERDLRMSSVETLLAQLQEELTPRILVDVTRMPDGEPFHRTHVGDLDGVRAPLRADQMLSARFWGIGFRHEQPADGDLHARRLVEAATHRLSSDLLGLQRILERFRDRSPPDDLRIVSAQDDRGFEHLLLDILNEDARRASRAPILEDFLEKTDFRVKYPDLERRRGARVQATSIISSKRHHEKRTAISRTEEYVFLSPLSLAEFATSLPSDVIQLDQCLETETSFVEGTAYEIRQILLRAIEAPVVSPLGPLARVPKPVRELIRRYVQSMAMDTTARLRSREAISGREPVTGRTRGRPRRNRRHRRPKTVATQTTMA